MKERIPMMIFGKNLKDLTKDELNQMTELNKQAHIKLYGETDDNKEPIKDYIKRKGIVRICKDNGTVMVLTKNHTYNSTHFKNAFKRASEVLTLNEDDPDYPTYKEDFIPDLKPGCNPKEMIYNTYNGFAIEPKQPSIISTKDNNYQGDTKAFYNHLKNVWCKNESEDVFELTIDIFAQLFQHPETKVGKAIVLRGRQGAGKGIIYHEFLEPIFGDAASETKKRISLMVILTGKFKINCYTG